MKMTTLNFGRTAALMICLSLLVLSLGGCGKKVIDPSTDRRVDEPAPAESESLPWQKETKAKPKRGQKPYTINGETYYPLDSTDGYIEEGLASWYGPDFHGRKTANGETYNMYAVSAAHKILPFDTRVRVTNLDNGKTVDVRVNDRGPFVRDRVIDLSRGAAEKIDLIGPGVARVRLEVLNPTPGMKDGDMPGRFYVQVGSFSMKENADALVRRMRERGHTGSRVQFAVVGGKNFWRVQAGAFDSLKRALSAQRTLEQEYPSCFTLAD